MISAYRNKPADTAITISIESGGWQVKKGDRICPNLTWGEMLEQVIHLTHSSIQLPRYKMLTPAEHRQEEALRNKPEDAP